MTHLTLTTLTFTPALPKKKKKNRFTSSAYVKRKSTGEHAKGHNSTWTTCVPTSHWSQWRLTPEEGSGIEPFTMKRWGLRHRGYRVGIIGVAVCSVFFVVGFAAPAWRNTMGLWMSCSQSQKLCVSHSNSGIGFPGVLRLLCWCQVYLVSGRPCFVTLLLPLLLA